MDQRRLAKIKAEYEAGLVTQKEIAKKHGCCRKTIYCLAKKHGWIYQRHHQMMVRKTEEKALRELQKTTLKNAGDLSRLYLEGSCLIRELLMRYAYKLRRDLKDEKVLTDREIFQGQNLIKCLKTAADTLEKIHNGERKALGLDREKRPQGYFGQTHHGVLVVPGTQTDSESWQKETLINQEGLIEIENAAENLGSPRG
ncbi:MAG: hypothetical protein OEY59_01045 [Deltaproteobacteria bacterium]|nr:hypothetical protein [Deltaproteobacteria bacterium]